ncbi:MAG: dienelactone hydrolase family protein [Bacteroidota bacterium]
MTSTSLVIRSAGVNLVGDLKVPSNPKGLIIFSHGSGSSRFSPRNRYVSEYLAQNGYATFLVDLLTELEDRDERNRFDISLLTDRLLGVVHYFLDMYADKFDQVGLFGASTGAASALRVASILGEDVFAVVSRGGRPDLAFDALDSVVAPTLLLVGGYDSLVLAINQRALMRLRGEKKLLVIPEATHLFEEPGKLEQVANASVEWLDQCLETKNIQDAFSKS